MKTCKNSDCKTEIENKFQYCRECAADRVRFFKSRWRKQNPNYNKFYLRKWKRDLRTQIEYYIAQKLKKLSLLTQ